MHRYLSVTIVVCVSGLLPMQGSSQESATKEHVESLIENLASKNPVPRERKGSTAEFPQSYDKKLQVSVFDAYKKLDELDEAAFPYLIGHFDDERYALTEDAGPMDKNFTVGQLCYHLVELQIQPDKGWTVGKGDPRTRKSRPHYSTHILLRDKAMAMRWSESIRGKSLLQLQLIAYEWIDQEEEKNSKDYTDEERRALAARLKTLRASRKALPSAVPWAK